MCYRVDCRQCGKYSWGGCGKHLLTLYASIDEGKRCMCRPWPGVAANVTNNNNQQQAATATATAAPASSNQQSS